VIRSIETLDFSRKSLVRILAGYSEVAPFDGFDKPAIGRFPGSRRPLGGRCANPAVESCVPTGMRDSWNICATRGASYSEGQPL